MAHPTVSIYGIPVSTMTMEQTVEYLTEAVRQKKAHQVITANPIMVMAALRDPEYMEVMKSADLIVPDGAGLVWAAKYVGRPVSERVPGIDLMQELLRAGERMGWKVYFLGASPDVMAKAVDRLRARYPRLHIVGWRDGYFDASQDEEVIRAIREAEPDLLFVGRSQDKQEPWIYRYREVLNVPVMMGVGGSFDVISGRLKRAPALFQKLRLEWLYRLLQEPWRYKRMLDLPRFVWKIIRDKKNV